jgi:hypothetical protein
MANTNKDPQFTAYIPLATLEALKASATREHRSINAQLVWFIEQGLAKEKKHMIWHNNTQSYRGETSDGQIVDVAGDEYAESLADGIKAEAEHRGYDPDNLTEEQREVCENATYQEIDDPNTWAGLVGDNPNVEYVK